MALAPTREHPTGRQRLGVAELRSEMGLTSQEIDRRKSWLDLGDGDLDGLARLDGLVGAHLRPIAEALVDRLSLEGGTSMPDRQALEDFLGGLTGAGDLDDAHVDRRLAMIASLQERVGPDLSWYLAAYLHYLRSMGERLREQPGEPDANRDVHRTLSKVVCLDLSLAVDAYLFERDRTIRAQQRELEELSTPVLQLRDGLLIIPIIGMLDARRAQQLTEQLLHAIRQRRARVVVLDVTGVAAVDSRVANHLIQTVDAARLMGAAAIITGVSPEVAQTLVGLGIDLGNVTTVADLQGGIDQADRLLGLRVVGALEPPGGLPA